MNIISRKSGLLALALVGGCACAWRPSAPMAADLAKSASSLRVDPASRPAFLKSYAQLPLSFEANTGQNDSQVKFTSRGAGYTLFLTGSEAVLALKKSEVRSQKPAERGVSSVVSRQLRQATDQRPKINEAIVRMKLVGANSNATVAGADELPGKANYFIGNDPKKWRTNVPTYAKVKYQDVYPGVDLVYYGNQGQLEYDFVVAPGADPRAIRLALGSSRQKAAGGGPSEIRRPDPEPRLDANGDLIVRIDGGELRFHKPVVYQTATGNRQSRTAITGRYRLAGSKVSFRLGAYDKSRPLVIDPALYYSTYLGGSAEDSGLAIAVDHSGSAYVTGSTYSTNFPTTPGSFETTYEGDPAVFVTKFDSTGSSLVYSTYLAGNSSQIGYGIAVNASGEAYATGYTTSTDFPVTAGSFQGRIAGRQNAFVTKLSSSGSTLAYSTYLGGDNSDQGQAIAVNSAGDAYVTGGTTSTNFPNTPGVFQDSCFAADGCSDAFVTEFNPTGTALVYSTFLGGTHSDYGSGIAVDASGNAYVTGATYSLDFPVTAGAFQRTNGGVENAFISKVNPGASQLVYSTYLGGNSYDVANAIAVDSSGDAYVVGITTSPDFPVTPGAFETASYSAAFVTKLNPEGTALAYSTFLGGAGDCEFGECSVDTAAGVSVDAAGDAYVAGTAYSVTFPTTLGSYEPAVPAVCTEFESYCQFAFLTEFNAAGSGLVYSTYLGSGVYGDSGYDSAEAIAINRDGTAFLTGYANDSHFPITAGAFQTTYGGDEDAFVAVFKPSANVGLSPASLYFPLQTTGTTSAPQTVVLANTGNLTLGIRTIGFTGSGRAGFTETNNCGGTLAVGASCSINVSFVPQVTGRLNASLTITDNAPTSPQTVSVTGQATTASLSISPSSLTFGAQAIYTSSPPQAITLTNTGTGTLVIGYIQASTGFTETNRCGSSVKAGASCKIYVTFDPLSSGTVTGSATITDNAPGSPQVVSLSGTGTDIQLSPSSLNFGSVTVGTTSAPRTISMENKSTSSVSITSIAITGADASDFAETNNCGSTLVPGEICSINVTFSPSAAGALSAIVSITDNGGASPQLAGISGTGVE